MSGPHGRSPSPSEGDRGRTTRACRTDRTAPRRTWSCCSQRLASSESLVHAVPVLDARFSELPAEIDLFAVTQTNEIDQAQSDVLRHATEVDDLLQAVADLAGAAFERGAIFPPLPEIDHGAAAHGDASLLVLHPF